MTATDEALESIAQQVEELAADLKLMKYELLQAYGVSEKSRRLNAAWAALIRAASAVRSPMYVPAKYDPEKR